MLNGQGNGNKINRSNQQEHLIARAAHFLYISLPLSCTTTTSNFQNLLGYSFCGGNVVRVLVNFLFYCRSFSPWWPLQNFHVVLPTKNVLFVFYVSLQLSVALFLVELRWPVAYFLCFSFSLFLLFQICGHDNQSKLNTLDNTDTEKISSFRFRY